LTVISEKEPVNSKNIIKKQWFFNRKTKIGTRSLIFDLSFILSIKIYSHEENKAIDFLTLFNLQSGQAFCHVSLQEKRVVSPTFQIKIQFDFLLRNDSCASGLYVKV
jgi:hypothetical protein